MSIDYTGNILLSGLYESNSISFDSHTIYKSGQRNIFIAKVDMNSNVLWVSSSTGNGYDNINCIASDNVGNNYILGSFSNSFSLGTYNISSNGFSDIYLVKFQ